MKNKLEEIADLIDQDMLQRIPEKEESDEEFWKLCEEAQREFWENCDKSRLIIK